MTMTWLSEDKDIAAKKRMVGKEAMWIRPHFTPASGG